MKVIKWIDDNFEEAGLLILLVIIGFTMMFQIMMRKVFGNPLPWPEELCRYCFIWSGYLSVGYCFRKNKVLKIDIVTQLFPKIVQNILEIIAEIIVLVFLVYIFYYSVPVLKIVSKSGQLSPALEVPMSAIYFAPVFGYGLGVLRYIQLLYKKYRRVNQ